MSDRGIELVRIYDDDEATAGAYRVLVDRLWPRGITKERAQLDEWAKDVAPSPDLRRWYGHDPARFEEFADRYCDELVESPARENVERLADLSRSRRVTLLTATRDVEHSGGEVLHEVLAQHLEGRGSGG